MMLKKDLSTMCYGFFSTLSNPTRLAIIEALVEQPMYVNQIAAELGQEQSMISHNLKHLVNCHFVYVRREGKQRVYTVNHETVDPLMRVVENHHTKFCLDGKACHLNVVKEK
jgi:DNA-binding transcriptional ArsR family regulator